MLSCCGKQQVGIKYCGGCNPHYERKDVARRIKEALLPEAIVYESWDAKNINFYIVICGCPTACAAIGEVIKTKPHWLCLSPGDEINIIGEIKKYLAGGI